MDAMSMEARWREEEALARIHGWDFSHIEARYEEQSSLPWDYREEILSRLLPQSRLLDIDTGGGEFLLSLKHPYAYTGATEGYPPNAELCARTLTPLGIDFRPTGDGRGLPFEENSFDVVINRHGDLCAAEAFRVLKPGGVFITQQVGAENDRALVDLLLPHTPPPFPEQYLFIARDQLERAGLVVEKAMEAYPAIRFFDVGALVWFAKIIEWEFPGFSVERCLDRLFFAERILEKQGVIEARAHRFLLVARRPAA